MAKSIIIKTPQHKNHKKDIVTEHKNKPWESEHSLNKTATSSKQRLQKHFPERAWHISSESKKGPKF